LRGNEPPPLPIAKFDTKTPRQSITFSNPTFEDTQLAQELADLRTINAELRAEGLLCTSRNSERDGGIGRESQKN